MTFLYKMNLKLFTVTLLLSSFIGATSFAAKVDTASTYSDAMHKYIKAVVIKPEGYAMDKQYPTLYLLHGFSGNYSDWIKKVPAIKDLSDKYNMLIVCPDGAFASWYIDSPENQDWKYATYIAVELVNWVDHHYNTIKDRSERAITGLSMGGHGALYLAFKYQETFGAAGSMSGVVDLKPFADSFGIEQILGKFNEYPERLEKNSVIDMVYLIKPKSLAITFDVGVDDFTYKVNLALHEKLMERNIPHDFTTRSGSHTWEYWGNSINYQTLFFSKFFNLAIKDQKKSVKSN
jgi:S-formylglutathione hydrolase FrmB